MRTLNRPMFNMGGPIKEGVMNGIREPYKGGQLVRPGPGRPGYQGLDPRKNILKKAAGWGASKIPGMTKGWAQRLWNKYKFPSRMQATTPTGPGITHATKARDFMHRAGQYFKQHPYLSTLGPAYLGTTAPVAGVAKGVAGAIPEIAQFGTEVLTPKRLEKYLPPDEWWKWKSDVEWKPGDIRGETPPPDKIDPSTVVNRGDPIHEKAVYGEKYLESKANKLAEAAKDKRLNKLLDIMGYDKSKKTAVYDALIDASQIVTAAPGGKELDITKDIISPIIAATGKRLDKPEQIREAVGLMMAKGEIEKDIFKSKGDASTQAIAALSTASGRSPKYVANAKLGIANTVSEAKSQLVKLKKTAVTSDDVTAVTMTFAEENDIPFKKQITTDEKNKVVGKGKKYPSVVEMLKAMELDPAGGDDGLYVVGTSIIQVEDGIPKLRG